MTKSLTLPLADEAATIELGQGLAKALIAKPTTAPVLLYLQGEIGAGKTCLTRALLRELGVIGAIKSPTFAIVEPYALPLGMIYHYDLYRLSTPDELDYLGWQEDFSDSFLSVVEWPELADGFLPSSTLNIELAMDGLARIAILHTDNLQGEALIQQLMIEGQHGAS